MADTGIGISGEHLPHIFEMFSQAAPALERSQGGLGIGLSLVRGLVELHGGSVEARSGGLGQGSEFVVRLPVRTAEDGRRNDEEGASSVPPSAFRLPPSLKILIVDDNQDNVSSLGLMLALSGHDIHTAHDGAAGVEAVEAFQPDVVLLDIGMPKMNGYDAARHIRQQPWGKEITLIAMTGWGQEEDKRRSREAGFEHHLVKPVDFATLERVLGFLAADRARLSISP